MREKLNENQTAQIALVAVLALVVGYLVLSSSGGGGSSSAASTPATSAPATSTEGGTVVSTTTIQPTTGTVESTGTTESAADTVESTPTAATSGVTAPAGRPLPKAVDQAYKQGETIALLVYRPGGIDDKKVSEAASVLTGMPGVAYFSTSVDHVADYSAITGPLGLSGAPALIVVQPRRRSEGDTVTATVDYGFQSAQDIKQAVIDAGYKGPDLTYAPE
jgi:hypothetical protein